jgi:hypothetical protein
MSNIYIKNTKKTKHPKKSIGGKKIEPISYIKNIEKEQCAPCALKKMKKKADKKDGIHKQDSFKTCYSKLSLVKIAELWNKENKKKINDSKQLIKIKGHSSKSLWNQIQRKLSSSCGSDEYCWKKQAFIKKLKDTEIEMHTFKPDYPKEWLRDRYTWLNTYDIYYVMKQYEKAHKDFIFLGPVPSDCPVSIHCELSKLDLMKLKKQGIHKIGIIYNLDVSSGPGTHWVGMYIDNKNNEINYYDSYGSKSRALIEKFVGKIAKQYTQNKLDPMVIYNDKRHQYGGSECGVYSMNFILERLHGTTMYDISQMDIPDEKMNYLRQLLYNTEIHKNIDK